MAFWTKQSKEWKEFEQARGVYVVEPLVKATLSWRSFDDVHDEKQSVLLSFEELKGKTLYAKHLLKNGKHFWKLFIVKSNTKEIHILYVPSESLNPTKQHRM